MVRKFGQEHKGNGTLTVKKGHQDYADHENCKKKWTDLMFRTKCFRNSDETDTLAPLH